MTWAFTTSQGIVARAGAGASGTASTSGALMSLFSQQAEAFINSQTRVDFNSKYSDMDADDKHILNHTADAFAAMMLVNYDTTGYTSARHAETTLDVLDQDVKRGVAIIKEMVTKEFLGVI